jgi:hypothetical protein
LAPRDIRLPRPTTVITATTEVIIWEGSKIKLANCERSQITACRFAESFS